MCISYTLVKIQTSLVGIVGSVNLVIFPFLIGQQDLGHFFRHRPSLSTGWRIFKEKITKKMPPALS
jgi:hypothetical protein